MRTSRRTTTVIGVAIAAACAIAIAAPASAATPGVTYVTTADITQPGTPTTVGWSNLAVTDLTSSANGLYALIQSRLTYGLATPLDATTGTALRDFLGASSFTSRNSGTSDYVQIPIDTSSGTEWIVSRSNGYDALDDLTLPWYPTFDIGSILADTPATLSQIDTQLKADPSLQGASILGLGFHIDDEEQYYTARINGVNFTFLPEPVVTAAPTTLTLAELTTTGVTISTTGFSEDWGAVLGEEVLFSASGPGWSITKSIMGNADSDGAFTDTFIGPVSANGGTFTIILTGARSGVQQTFAFNVTGDSAPAELVVTGADAYAPLIAGGTLLLLGSVALTVVAAKRRRTV